ncbi:hypothetical protein AND_004934 [Anopheles darlingi]|uniref:Uncharacterized protein n=1 Tax=Anopheles darlingi TaxID=43151 RepID=W5JG71_ANODA|nr:uncharacterized protein LOC125955999 [Anopheles darlingi]ETN63367.1 hypothetical protein AND_004934 [Anopheles darlingi]
MDIWYTVTLWMCGFCSLCALLYICTVRAQLRSWKGKGKTSQQHRQITIQKPNPTAGSFPVLVYVIQPDVKPTPCFVNLNYDDLLKNKKDRKAELLRIEPIVHGSTVNLVSNVI